MRKIDSRISISSMGLHQLACVGISIRTVIMHGILAPTNEWRIMCQPLFCQLMMLRANSVAYPLVDVSSNG